MRPIRKGKENDLTGSRRFGDLGAVETHRAPATSGETENGSFQSTAGMVVRIAAGLLLLTALAPVASQLCAANATPTAASLNVQLTPSVVELHKPTLVSVDGGAVRPGDRVVLLQEGDESSMELFVLDSSFTINVNYVTLGTRLARTPWPHLESSRPSVYFTIK